jgi:hypothetical protein
MRKALIVGIDHYPHLGDLTGCVNDAVAVKSVLERHADNTSNFQTPKMLLGTGAASPVHKAAFRSAVKELFDSDAEIALLYFAGHGHAEDAGGYLCASDSATGEDGLAMHELMTWASNSAAKNKVIILDSCYSGTVANNPTARGNSAELAEGMTILTASTSTQTAKENPAGGGGVFTNLLVDALEGGAMNLVGEITPGSVYAHIDQSLGTWGVQRPMFKTHVKSFVYLRKAEPPMALQDLQALARHFPTPDFQFPLDPAYEPERTPEQAADPNVPQPNPAKNAVFKVLQNYVKVGLVRPVGAPHMWHAAMSSKACELTVLGRHYRNLVAQDLI